MKAVLAALALALGPGAAVAQGFATLDGHGGPVMDIAASDDGRVVASASFDYAAALWDLGEARLLRRLEGHRAAAVSVDLTGDGRLAATGGDDFRAILWRVADGAALHALEGHRGKVRSVRFSPDGATLATAGWDGRAGLWDVATGALLRWIEVGESVNDIAFSADGTRLWTADHGGEVRRWRVGDGGFEAVEVAHGFGVNRLARGPGWLAYGAVDGGTRVIDLADGRVLADVTLERRPILALALSTDGGRLAVGDGDGYIMVLDTADWSIARDFRAVRDGPVWALAWSGDRLISGGLDPSAPVWPALGDTTPFGAAERGYHRDPASMGPGERQFMRKCSICHTLTADHARRAGPGLGGLFGRRAGSAEGYAYSAALRGVDLVWSADTVDRLFRDGPEVVTPGSKMPMQRIARAEDRAALIAFLRRATAPHD